MIENKAGIEIMTQTSEYVATNFLVNDLINTPHCKESICEKIQYLNEELNQAREATESLLGMNIFSSKDEGIEEEVLSDFRKRLVLIRKHLVLEQKEARDAFSPGLLTTSPAWNRRYIEKSLLRIREAAISSPILSGRLGIGAYYYYSAEMPDVTLVRTFEELTYLENALHERKIYGWPT